MGRWLADAGHRVRGIDSSPTLVAHAVEAGGYEQVLFADAGALPWPEDAFDLVPDPARAIGEIARVLVPGGRLCIAIVHPLNASPVSLENDFAQRHFIDSVIEELREPQATHRAVSEHPELAPAAPRHCAR